MNNLSRILAILLVPITLALAGCTAAPSATEPTDLLGEWSYSQDSLGFDAEVTDGTIDIFLTLDDTRGLYWSGTFQDAAVDGAKIISKADTEALESSLYGSQSDTKEFTFTNGEINFEFTILGVVSDVSLER